VTGAEAHGVPAFADARILIVDDEPANVRLLKIFLRLPGYTDVVGVSDPRVALSLCGETQFDLILLDLRMPHLSGFDVLEQLQPYTRLEGGNYLPVLVLTGDDDPVTQEKALSLGARDFITKPFSQTEVLLRINNLLDMRSLHLQLKGQNDLLESKVTERTTELLESVIRLEQAEADLRTSHEETIRRLSLAAEYRDDDTARHIQRMSRYCYLLAERFGRGAEECELLRLASQMHDVGKIGVPDGILLKPGPLTETERLTMQKHAEIGHDILRDSKSSLLQMAATVALCHHERIDGLGYPFGLSGEAIPVEGRIAAVADVFDALTSDRIYRPAFPIGEAIAVMKEGRGTQFDETILDLFLEAVPEMLQVKQMHDDD
jgi:putative two-component system response regulator